jgi:acetyl-CoA C-acetyltransferase
MHSIATMVERLRVRRDAIGLVTALGWYLTKHAVGLYGANPPPRPWTPPDAAAIQARVDAEPGPELATTPSGAGTVETYTVLFDRDGPVRGIVVGRLDDGRRFLANPPSDPAILDAMTREEAIGRRGRVSPDGDTNRFDFI